MTRRRTAQDIRFIIYGIRTQPARDVRAARFEFSVLAPSYSCLSTTIASGGLNCRVRNENGCTPSDKAPTQNTQKILNRYGLPYRFGSFGNENKFSFRSLALPLETEERHKKFLENYIRDSHNSFREFCRLISTPRLNTLLRFHLVPINVVISHES